MFASPSPEPYRRINGNSSWEIRDVDRQRDIPMPSIERAEDYEVVDDNRLEFVDGFEGSGYGDARPGWFRAEMGSIPIGQHYVGETGPVVDLDVDNDYMDYLFGSPFGSSSESLSPSANADTPSSTESDRASTIYPAGFAGDDSEDSPLRQPDTASDDRNDSDNGLYAGFPTPYPPGPDFPLLREPEQRDVQVNDNNDNDNDRYAGFPTPYPPRASLLNRHEYEDGGIQMNDNENAVISLNDSESIHDLFDIMTDWAATRGIYPEDILDEWDDLVDEYSQPSAHDDSTENATWFNRGSMNTLRTLVALQYLQAG